jgi:hypothetical protein
MLVTVNNHPVKMGKFHVKMYIFSRKTIVSFIFLSTKTVLTYLYVLVVSSFIYKYFYRMPFSIS